MRFRLFIWVLACWLCILASVALEVMLCGWVIYVLHSFAGQPAGVVELFAQNLTIVVFLGWLAMSAALEKSRSEISSQKGDVMVARRLSFLEKILVELCDKRQHPQPDVLFVRSGRANDRIMVGMLDNVFTKDVLCLHPDIIGILTESQMRAVLAHELRHSNALENILTRFCRYLVPAFSFTAIWLTLTSVFNCYAWWNPFAAVALVVLTLIVCFFARNFRSRFVEYKTDALSTLESQDPESLISALKMVWRVLSVELPFLKDRHDAWWIGVFNTHPSNKSRARALRWIHR